MTSELTELHKRYTALMEERNSLDARVAVLEDGIRDIINDLRGVPIIAAPESSRRIENAKYRLAALLPEEKQ